jgi:hypothetical protein
MTIHHLSGREGVRIGGGVGCAACRLDHRVGVLIMVVCVGAAAGACWVVGGAAVGAGL